MDLGLDPTEKRSEGFENVCAEGSADFREDMFQVVEADVLAHAISLASSFFRVWTLLSACVLMFR